LSNRAEGGHGGGETMETTPMLRLALLAPLLVACQARVPPTPTLINAAAMLPDLTPSELRTAETIVAMEVAHRCGIRARMETATAAANAELSAISSKMTRDAIRTHADARAAEMLSGPDRAYRCAMVLDRVIREAEAVEARASGTSPKPRPL
jgi:hypothetical protein